MAENKTGNQFSSAVEAIFQGMDHLVATKTVVGDAVRVDDAIILPLMDVSCGMAAGAFGENAKNKGAGGMSAKLTPSAILVIQNGSTKLVNVKNQDGITKILDMVPELVNKFADRNAAKKQPKADEAAREAAAQDLAEKLNLSKEEEEK